MRSTCLPFVPVLALSCAVAAQDPRPAAAANTDAPVFHPPVRLHAAGQPIDAGDDWGHCGPTVHDVDGDGVRDLLVGDFSGKFKLFRNTGTNAKPKYAAGKWLTAGGVKAKVPVY